MIFRCNLRPGVERWGNLIRMLLSVYPPCVRVDLALPAPHSRTAMLALSLPPRVAVRHALTASSASPALRCRPRAPPQRCGGVRCQIFPSDFAQQSELEADEAGDAARAVLRARRAVGAAVPPGERPSQEWCEGVLD